MPGQRGSEARQRNHMYTIRWSADEFERLEEIAAASGCEKADVLRRLIVHDHGRILPTRDLTRQILAVGNNLNQIAQSVNAMRRQFGQGAPLNSLAQLQTIEADFRRIYDAIVVVRRQMDAWR